MEELVNLDRFYLAAHKHANAITQKDVLNALDGLPEDHQHCVLLATHTLAADCDNDLENTKTGGK